MNSLLEESENAQDSELKKQKLEKAAEIANQMLENQNESDAAHYVLSKNASQNKKYDDALSELEKAINLNRENPLYYYDKGKILYLKRRYEDAQWNFEKACELNENFYQSKYNLGLTFEKLNQNGEAKKAFSEAIEIKNNYEKAFLELARINAKENCFSEAEKNYQKALEINPDNPKIFDELGSLYFQNGDIEKSEEYFKKAIESRPKGEESTLAKYNLSTVLLDSGDFVQAQKYAWQAYDEKGFVKNENNQANIIYNYALILEKNGKTEDAKEKYQEVLKINPNAQKAKINLSAILMKENQVDLDYVLEMLLSAYKTDSDGFEVNNNLGTCYLLKKDYKNAVIHYEKAAKKSSDNEILKNLANAYLENGDLDKSCEIYEKMILQDSQDWNSFVNLGKIYLQQGKVEESMKALLTVRNNAPDFRKQEVDSLIELLTGVSE